MGARARWARRAAAAFALPLLAACGGGGSGGTPTGPPPPTSSVVFTPAGTGGTNSVSLVAESSTDPTTLVLDVHAGGVTDLYGVAFNLTYPKQVLQFAGATEGTFENAAGSVNTAFQVTESPAGTLVVAVSRLGAVTGASGSGTLVTLRFTATASGSGAFTFSRNRGFDSTGAQIAGLTWVAGSVQVTLVR
jgi:hypothetical protein